MSRSAVVLLAALAPVLGGCFVSSDALITTANADHPWSNLRVTQLKWEAGDWKPDGLADLRREGALYRFEPDGDSAYTYALLVVDGKRIYQYAFDYQSRRCEIPGVDAAALKLKPYEDGCGVPSLAAMTQIFTTLLKSQPKYETIYQIEP